jgi:tetratricopeptide (TPR) repeat protein
MLSAEPGERFQTAGELADALAAPTGVWTPRSLAAERRRRWGAGVAALLALGAVVVVVRPWAFGARIKTSNFSLGPCLVDPKVPTAVLDQARCENLLHTAFGQWSDVQPVSSPRALGAAAADRATLSLEVALDSARADKLDFLPWVSITPTDDSLITIRMTLWDVGERREVARSEVLVRRDLRDLDAKVPGLMDSLTPNMLHGLAAGPSHTKVLAALLAFGSAGTALERWDLHKAAAGLRRAVTADSGYSEANLWLAQVMAWQREPKDEWAQYAMLAAQAGPELSEFQRMLARALVATAERRYADACEEYTRLIRRDSTNFAAWYGLGDCQTDDRSVVADSGSPSGWAFRTSVHTALQAYRRAFQLNPFANRAFADRFTNFSFLLEGDGFRSGRAVPPDSGNFGGRLTLQDDTLAIVPYRMPEALSRPASSAALVRVREALREIALRWVHAARTDPEARAHLSLVLETQGQLRESPEIDASALGSLQEARRLAHDSALALRLAVDEVRLRLKVQDWSAAARLADSILAAHAEPAPGAAALLGPVAMLMGRASRAADFLARSLPADTVMLANGDVTTLLAAPDAHRAALRLSAFAGVGAPAESIRVLEGRVDSLIALTVPPSGQRAVEAQIVNRSVELGFPVLGASPVHLRAPAERQPTWMLRRQQEYAAGNTEAVREAFRHRSPAIVSIDETFLQAWLLAAIGDTGRAIVWLDGSLTRMNAVRTDLLDRRQAGGLIRAMALRAELAEAVGDRPTARYWGNALATLWADADPSLRPLVERMRRLSGRL